MTYSIIAREPRTGELGIAVASRFFAVGSLVPHLRGGVGAFATQALANPVYGVDGVAMLADGVPPEAVAQRLTARDGGREHRQFHLIDAQGRGAAFTGQACMDWAGHRMADNVSVAGNILAGPRVVDEMLDAYLRSDGLPFAERLLLALDAAEAAGGDRRGQQSAALVICRDQDYPWLSVRTDDHADPLGELRRLYAVAQEQYLHFADMLPTRENPAGVTDREAYRRRVAEHEAARAAEGLGSRSHATSRPDREDAGLD
ncbi:DUF1028 domain-containing protein [Acidihalobacter prosperus]|uniref:Pilus assembly protein n=1 Tax=Acidihalobacter prosperus TaxID=160660 RepID=A0A1A6C0A8_9GAMM|nr:DUF1028 domain-containing protein [Acidihalobacter prosperus]OBS07989.1 hypothetical protein Thpro_022239 [Acidihalobacter prosperus]